LALLTFLVAMATMALTCLSTGQATATASANIKTALRSNIKVHAKPLPDGLTTAMADQIASMPGMTGAYELNSELDVRYQDHDGHPLSLTPGADDPNNPNDPQDLARLSSVSDSTTDPRFASGDLELTSGKPITQASTHQVLLHEDFARRHGLGLGDIITLRDEDSSQPPLEVTIVGLFTHTSKQPDSSPTNLLFENMSYSDAVTGSDLAYGASGGQIKASHSGAFFVAEPDDIDQLIDQIRALPGLDSDWLMILKDDADYLNARDALGGMSRVVLITILVITVLSFAILSGFLGFHQQHRIHETGVLLAMGVPKGSIVGQRVMEVALVTGVGFTLAWGLAALIGQTVADRLLSRTPSSQVQGLTDLAVVVTPGSYLLVLVTGLALCALATMVALVPTLRLKPSAILSHMS
jgi:putative ABC transport system permease protein